jgi:hypothetical protein
MVVFPLLEVLISVFRSLLEFIAKSWGSQTTPASKRNMTDSSSSTYKAPDSYPSMPLPPPYQPSTSSAMSSSSSTQPRSASYGTPASRAALAAQIGSSSATSRSTTASTTSIITPTWSPPPPIVPVDRPLPPLAQPASAGGAGGDARRVVIALDYGTTYTGTFWDP